MRGVLAEMPDYGQGWTELWNWCRSVNDYAGCLEAAEALVRLSPQHEISFGYLGEAKRLNKDKDGAIVAFARAFTQNPRYDFAGNGLFDLQMAAGDYQGAAATLALLRQHCDNVFTKARALQLAVRNRDQKQTDSLLMQICTSPCDNTWPAAAAVQAMVDARWPLTAEKILEKAMLNPAAHMEAGRQWVRLRVAQTSGGVQRGWGNCERAGLSPSRSLPPIWNYWPRGANACASQSLFGATRRGSGTIRRPGELWVLRSHGCFLIVFAHGGWRIGASGRSLSHGCWRILLRHSVRLAATPRLRK